MRTVLFIAAIVLFLLAALLTLTGNSTVAHDVLASLPLFGLACLAAGHVVPD